MEARDPEIGLRQVNFEIKLEFQLSTPISINRAKECSKSMKLNGIYCCIPWLYSMCTPVQLVHCWEFLFILLSKLPFFKTLAKLW